MFASRFVAVIAVLCLTACPGPDATADASVMPRVDASVLIDSGQPDAGQPDAGQPDAGQPDAGQPDAGQPDAGDPSALIDGGAGLCTVEGWCWEFPTPQGNTLEAIWVSATGVRFVAGKNTLLRIGDGVISQPLIPGGGSAWWQALKGFSDSDVWAAGLTGLSHFDGTRWSTLTPTDEPITGLSGVASNDLWAVGWGGLILHWDGTTWTQVASTVTENLNAVFAASANDAWACGNAGKVIRWNGTVWAPVTSGTSEALNGVWGSATDSVRFVGDASTRLRFNGTAIVADNPSSIFFFTAISGSASDDVWAVGLSGELARWNGSAWVESAAPDDVRYNAVLVVSKTEAWAVGENGVMIRWNGASWSRMANGPILNVTSLWKAQSGQLWATTGVTNGASQVLRRESTGWVSLYQSPVFNTLSGIWGSGPDSVWAVGQKSVLFYNGASWSAPTTPSTEWLLSVHGIDATHVWAVGQNGTILFWNGTAWVKQISTTTADLQAVYAIAANDVWVAGYDGVLLHFTGTTWVGQTHALVHGYALYAASASDLYVAGIGGIEWRVAGSWAKLSSRFSSYVDVTGSSSTDITAAPSLAPGLWHFNGVSGSVERINMGMPEAVEKAGTVTCVGGTGITCRK